MKARVLSLAFAGLFLAPSAFAGDITANYSWSFLAGQSITYYGNPENPNAADITGSKTGGSENIIKNPSQFLAFCVEIDQHLYPGSNYHSDVDFLVNGITTKPTNALHAVTFNQTQVDLLGRLWNDYVPLLSVQSDYEKFQLAVWEITFDGGTTNLGAGNFQYAGGYSTDVGNMLAQAAQNGNKTTLAILRDDDRQDLITEAVPEPFTLALGLAGLGVAIARRRRRA